MQYVNSSWKCTIISCHTRNVYSAEKDSIALWDSHYRTNAPHFRIIILAFLDVNTGVNRGRENVINGIHFAARKLK